MKIVNSKYVELMLANKNYCQKKNISTTAN